MNTLKDFISKSKRIVFFGGAGVSTESGMKDYRSEDGLYSTVKKYGVSPEVILSHSFFMRSPEAFFDFYYNYFLKNSYSPNRAHEALAYLEKTGKLSAVITQNIDGLHQQAGSKNVLELHGTVKKNHCTKCGIEASDEEIKSFAGKVPHCTCGGIFKPDVVLYEEPLDENTVLRAIDEIKNADLLIVGGTSLAVYPAAGFLQYFCGENIIVINKGETGIDERATLVIRDSIGKVLSEAVFD